MLESENFGAALLGNIPPQTVVWEGLLCGTCVVGDYLLAHGNNAAPVRAITDSLTHGLVAFFSWKIVRPETNWISFIEMVLCLLLAMAIDVDHFIAAQSFDLQVNNQALR